MTADHSRAMPLLLTRVALLPATCVLPYRRGGLVAGLSSPHRCWGRAVGGC